MTHPPVVLVHIYACKHVYSPLPQDIWADEVCSIPAKIPSTNPPSFSTSPPRKPNQRASLGGTYVDMCIWIPRLLMVLSNRQGTLPGPQDGCGAPNFSSSRGLIGASVQETHHAPHQIKFDTDSLKFLIDSGHPLTSGIIVRISSPTRPSRLKKGRMIKFWV